MVTIDKILTFNSATACAPVDLYFKILPTETDLSNILLNKLIHLLRHATLLATGLLLNYRNQ